MRKTKPENSIWRTNVAERKGVADDKAARLRELRLADETARRAAGSWGDLTVREVRHEPTGAVFVHYWKGRSGPSVEKPTRPAGLSAPEYAAYSDWIRRHQGKDFRHVLVAWNLSKDEAERIKQERIDLHAAAQLQVINAVKAC